MPEMIPQERDRQGREPCFSLYHVYGREANRQRGRNRDSDRKGNEREKEREIKGQGENERERQQTKCESNFCG